MYKLLKYIVSFSICGIVRLQQYHERRTTVEQNCENIILNLIKNYEILARRIKKGTIIAADL